MHSAIGFFSDSDAVVSPEECMHSSRVSPKSAGPGPIKLTYSNRRDMASL